MKKILLKTITGSIERKLLVIFLLGFIGVVASGWLYAMKLRQTVAANGAVLNVDVRALIEVERMRNISESQISNARSFFLLGSRALFDKQKKDKQTLMESLAAFEKQYSLPQVSDVIKRIDTLEQQLQEFFDQGMEFREKQTESKIVGQFFQAKSNPIRNQLNDAFDEIMRLHNAELDRARAKAREAASSAEVQIPRGMTWFTGLISALFLGMTLLLVRMLRERTRKLAERDRLYDEAKRAVQSRDEVISAISQDLHEPLTVIKQSADSLTAVSDAPNVQDRIELIKSSTVLIEDTVKDICDQKKADMGTMTLRMNQLGIDEVLDEARIILQPVAKQRDVRLQFDSVNPPVLAFFDRERVLRVLANLVGNAIKFSPKHSKVVVKVRSDQKFVYISVVDSGPGIPEKQASEIFDRFWQAKKTSDQGAGIGLAIVKTIVEAHGGTVHLDSQSSGSTFTFSLPRRRPVGAHLGKPTPTIKHTLRSHLPGADFHDGSTY